MIEYSGTICFGSCSYQITVVSPDWNFITTPSGDPQGYLCFEGDADGIYQFGILALSPIDDVVVTSGYRVNNARWEMFTVNYCDVSSGSTFPIANFGVTNSIVTMTLSAITTHSRIGARLTSAISPTGSPEITLTTLGSN